MATNVYTSPSIPQHWIMRSVQGTLWIVPATPLNGWSLKRQYRGHEQSLRPVRDYEAERAIRHADAGFDLLRSNFAEYVTA